MVIIGCSTDCGEAAAGCGAGSSRADIGSMPQLTYGKPVDLSADVPIFPPFATGLTALLALGAWLVTGQRVAFVPAPLNKLAVRVIVVAAVVASAPLVMKVAGNELDRAGSGTFFTPVNGLATTGPYKYSRNPMYAGLIFVVLPGFAIAVDSLWAVIFDPLLFLYLRAH